MKKLALIIVSIISILSLASVPLLVSAETFDPFGTVCEGSNSTGSTATTTTVCNEKSKTDDPLTGNQGILIRAARFVTLITGIASIIIIMYAGIKYVTAGGDSNSINSAKSTLVYAFIGLVISLLSQGIILFVINNVK